MQVKITILLFKRLWRRVFRGVVAVKDGMPFAVQYGEDLTKIGRDFSVVLRGTKGIALVVVLFYSAVDVFRAVAHRLL